jgi:hypothetical protein
MFSFHLTSLCGKCSLNENGQSSFIIPLLQMEDCLKDMHKTSQCIYCRKSEPILYVRHKRVLYLTFLKKLICPLQWTKSIRFLYVECQ